jgi:hypothetical protein
LALNRITLIGRHYECKRLISTETVDCHRRFGVPYWHLGGDFMALKKPLGTVLDVMSYILSWSGIAFLFGAGIDKLLPYSSVTIIHQYRWLGFWMVASAIALAIRVPSFSSPSVGEKEHA